MASGVARLAVELLKRLFGSTPKRFIIYLAVFLLPYTVFAQTDKEFWFAAPAVYQDASRDFNKPIVVRLTTSSAPATVTISLPANSAFVPITTTINANSTVTVDLSAFLSQLENKPANTVLSKGLLIKSTADITAYYEEVSGCDCNPETFSLKGKNALGTEFFISSQYTFNESTAYPANNSFDIVATKDGTHVTITPSKNIVGHPANVPFTITLNAGQTYSAVATSTDAAGHLQGSYVTADNPVAVTLKDDLVQVSSCADLVGDQTVPTSVLGTEYIVTKGLLTPNDYVYITAIANNTAIFLSGNTTPAVTLSKGESYTITLGGGSLYIRSSEKIYVYQFTGNGCEAGSAIIPKLNCTGSKSVSVVRSKTDQFAVMITTKAGNQNSFAVNGNAGLISGSVFNPVPGTNGGYVAARIDLTNSAAVNTPLNFTNTAGNFSLGMINGGVNNGTEYGFFSDYKSSNVDQSSVDVCPGGSVQLNAFGGATYLWTPVIGLSNPAIANPIASPTITTDYNVTITSPDGCVDFATVHVNVLNTVTPSVSIASSANNVCSGTPVTFTATPVNGGVNPLYQWQVNGVNVAGSATFTTSTFTNNDKVSCIMTSSLCATPANVTSNIIVMNVAAAAMPSVTITASQSTVCAGSPVTFTASAANQGTPTSYQWQVNGANIINTSTSVNIILNNGDRVTCVMTTNTGCSAPVTVTSNVIAINVLPKVTPFVGITASQNNICTGTIVTFTATPLNGGTAPVYQWQVNGVDAGAGGTSFTSIFNNGDRVQCLMTGNADCATLAVAPSNIVTMTVNAYVAPAVSIAASTTSICQGTNVKFTATPVNGGTNPNYQWQVNGINTGTNAAIFTTANLANNDVVSCILTSSGGCFVPASATSNPLIVTVNASVTPSVSITASANNICAGTPVVFTATVVNGGPAPVYQWQKNGVNTGANLATYASNVFSTGDIVTCTVTSSAFCATPTNVTSNSIVMDINPNQPPSVSISTFQNNVCVGANVTFTAVPINGGTAPIYQWQVNGANAGSNAATFTSSTLVNGDKVTCILTSNASCVTTAIATSNAVTMILNPYVNPSVTIAASANNICPGAVISFSATPLNGGNSPDYQWRVNGINAGANSPVFTGDNFTNGDVVSCILTANGTCTTIAVATSNDIVVSVNAPVTSSVSIAASANNVCPGTPVTFTATLINGEISPVYQWQVNGVNAGTNNSTFTSAGLANNDAVTCTLTSAAKCAVPLNITSNTLTMAISPVPVIDGGGDKTIETGSIVQLNASVTGNVAGVVWSPATGLDNPGILTPHASPLVTTLYTITVTSVNGCTTSATVKVNVMQTVTIPSAFTPNGDGINDKWIIKNIEYYPNSSVKIFNRWGGEVYSSTAGYHVAWDGTHNGKRLPTGTYYYVITLTKGAKPTTGAITVIW